MLVVNVSPNKKLSCPCVCMNWARILKKCTPSSRDKVITIQTKYQQAKAKIMELQSNFPNFDWENYQKILPEDYIKDQKSRLIEFRPRDTTKEHKELDKEQEVKIKQVEETLIGLRKQIESAKKRLSKFENLGSIDELTVDKYMELYPEIQKRVDSKIEKEDYTVSDSPK